MSIPAVCITGWSNSGKTTLIEKLTAHWHSRGLRVSVLKHSHHPVLQDKEGSDTQRYLRAGAVCAGMAGMDGALVRYAEPSLDVLLRAVSGVDLILVEGYDQEAELPMIEVWRDAARPMRAPKAQRRAVVTSLEKQMDCPVFAPEEIEQIADFIEQCVGRT